MICFFLLLLLSIHQKSMAQTGSSVMCSLNMKLYFEILRNVFNCVARVRNLLFYSTLTYRERLLKPTFK